MDRLALILAVAMAATLAYPRCTRVRVRRAFATREGARFALLTKDLRR